MTSQTRSDYAALLLRLGLGTLFLAHGLLKVVVFTLPGTAGFFESVGFPGWTAYPVAVGEIVAGLLLVAGVAVRPVSLAMIPVMLGALWVHLPAGWVFSNPGGGWEFPAFWTLALVVQALLGAGALALRLPSRRLPAPAWGKVTS